MVSEVKSTKIRKLIANKNYDFLAALPTFLLQLN
jgi:hypothetical protein